MAEVILPGVKSHHLSLAVYRQKTRGIRARIEFEVGFTPRYIHHISRLLVLVAAPSSSPPSGAIFGEVAGSERTRMCSRSAKVCMNRPREGKGEKQKQMEGKERGEKKTGRAVRCSGTFFPASCTCTAFKIRSTIYLHERAPFFVVLFFSSSPIQAFQSLRICRSNKWGPSGPLLSDHTARVYYFLKTTLSFRQMRSTHKRCRRRKKVRGK